MTERDVVFHVRTKNTRGNYYKELPTGKPQGVNKGRNDSIFSLVFMRKTPQSAEVQPGPWDELRRWAG